MPTLVRVVHRELVAEPAERRTTNRVAMVQIAEHVVPHPTGAVAVVVAQQRLVRTQLLAAVTVAMVARRPSPAHRSRMPVVAVVAEAIAVSPATPRRPAELVVLAVAVTVDHQHGMALTVALAPALAELQALVAVVAEEAIAPEHKFLALQMVAEAAAVRELLCCVTSYLLQQPQILQLHQTAVHHPQTTSRATKHSPSRAMQE
jgi:hypothetical protein